MKSFKVPPRAISRLTAASRTRVSSPIRTKAVFSVTPVASEAACNKASSILIVVRICIKMPLGCIQVKTKAAAREGKPLCLLSP